MLELKHQVAIGGITHDGDADALHSMGGGDPVTHGWSHVQQELVQFVSSGYLDTVTQVGEAMVQEDVLGLGKRDWFKGMWCCIDLVFQLRMAV